MGLCPTFDELPARLPQYRTPLTDLIFFLIENLFKFFKNLFDFFLNHFSLPCLPPVTGQSPTFSCFFYGIFVRTAIIQCKTVKNDRNRRNIRNSRNNMNNRNSGNGKNSRNSWNDRNGRNDMNDRNSWNDRKSKNSRSIYEPQ